MKNLSIIFLLLLPVMVMGQYYPKYETVYRNYSDSSNGGFYVPFTNPPGQPHYSADITVYKIDKCDTVQIGYPFEGKYTPKGCFEDDPKYLISEAKKSVKPQELKIDSVTLSRYMITDSLWGRPAPVKLYDTIPVVMLVSDTAKMEVGTRWDSETWTLYKQSMYNYYNVSFMFGYELIGTPEYWYSDPISGYLDDKKKLLSKSIIVWQSKRR
ncbi:MAG TPA: hypothetical protein PK914_07745 [Smithellaceae bacterium]|nr:hypothetical protein [Smithellaceae bacterium]